MSRLNLKSLFTAAVVAGGMMFAGSSAFAGCYDDYAYEPVCTYKTVITYETRRVQDFEWVIRYDAYGAPYRAKVLTWKTITVPVEKLVKVCY